MTHDLANAVGCARQVRRTVARLSRQLRPNLRRDGIGMAKLSVIAHIKRVGRVTPTGDRRLAEAAHEKDLRLAKLIQTRLSAEHRTVLLTACALMEGLSDVFGAAGA